MFPASHWAELARLRSQPASCVVELALGEGEADHDAAELLAKRERFAGECAALVVRLAVEWGPAERLDLLPLWERHRAGERVGEALGSLCEYGGATLHAWPPHGRLVGLGFGRPARHLPCRLLAAVGEESEQPG